MHLILLSILLTVTMAEPDNCKNKDSCDIQDYMEQRNCPATHSDREQECKCTKKTKEDCADTNPIKNKDMTIEKCKELCQNLTDCVFYRWDKVGFSNVITCTLMSEKQCNQKGSVCVPFSKGCESDALEGICSSDSDVRPEGQNCDISLPDKRVSADHYGIKISWVCFDPFSREGKELDVYDSNGVSVLNGVKCETSDRCTDFGAEADAPFVTYTCNNTEWQLEDGSTHDQSPVDDDGKLAKELVCSIEPLKVPKANLSPETGAELICFTALGEDGDNYVVNPPNSCAFLCEKHHVVTIQSGWADQQNGKAGWNLYVVGDPQPQPSPITDGAELSCWSQRIFGHRRRGY